MAVMVAGLLQWLSVSDGLGGQQTYTEDASSKAAEQQGIANLPRWEPTGGVDSTVVADSPGADSGEHWRSVSTGAATAVSTLFPPSPTPSVVEAATARVSSQGGQLTEPEAIAVLEAAGWPTELIPQALAVAWCESKWSPGAVGDSGRSMGLFQVNLATWFPYAGEDPSQWSDPLVNARVAWATYNYDLSRGYAPWKQWSCKP